MTIVRNEFNYNDFIRNEKLQGIAKELVEWIYTDVATKKILDAIVKEVSPNGWIWNDETRKIEALKTAIGPTKPDEFSIRANALIAFLKVTEGKAILAQDILDRTSFVRKLLERCPKNSGIKTIFSDERVLERVQAYFTEELEVYLSQRQAPPPPPMRTKHTQFAPPKAPGEAPEALPYAFISAPSFDSASVKIQNINDVALPGNPARAYYLTKNELFYYDKWHYKKFKNIPVSSLQQVDAIREMFQPPLTDESPLSDSAYSTILSPAQVKTLLSMVGLKETKETKKKMDPEEDKKNTQAKLNDELKTFTFNRGVKDANTRFFLAKRQAAEAEPQADMTLALKKRLTSMATVTRASQQPEMDTSFDDSPYTVRKFFDRERSDTLLGVTPALEPTPLQGGMTVGELEQYEKDQCEREEARLARIFK